MTRILSVPVPYGDALDEIVKILDAYALNPDTAWKVVRMAAILDAENSEGFTIKTLMDKYKELHDNSGEQ